jgi:hypothetical protein
MGDGHKIIRFSTRWPWGVIGGTVVLGDRTLQGGTLPVLSDGTLREKCEKSSNLTSRRGSGWRTGSGGAEERRSRGDGEQSREPRAVSRVTRTERRAPSAGGYDEGDRGSGETETGGREDTGTRDRGAASRDRRNRDAGQGLTESRWRATKSTVCDTSGRT